MVALDHTAICPWLLASNASPPRKSNIKETSVQKQGRNDNTGKEDQNSPCVAVFPMKTELEIVMGRGCAPEMRARSTPPPFIKTVLFLQ